MAAKFDKSDPIKWLAAILTEKKKRNPSYSLRAYARHLGVSPGKLSQILSEKRPLTYKSAEQIAIKLEFDPLDTDLFLQSVTNKKAGREIPQHPTKHHTKQSYVHVSEDQFNLLANWYHYAILSLMETEQFRSSHSWIASTLGITKDEVKSAMALLQRVSLVEKTDKGYQLHSAKGTFTNEDIPSEALRMSHRQTLQQAMDAMDHIPVNLRHVTSVTMAIDPEKIAEAKKMIDDFLYRLSNFLESGKKQEVCNLNIQLIPLTDINEGIKSQRTTSNLEPRNREKDDPRAPL